MCVRVIPAIYTFKGVHISMCVLYTTVISHVNILCMSHCRENTYWWYLQMVQDLTNLHMYNNTLGTCTVEFG